MSWLTRFGNALNPRQLDREIAEELQDHLERRAADFTASGLAPDEARRQAFLRLGNPAVLREDSRDMKLWTTLESILQDARYAWRGLLKSPAFTATAVLSLSVAIGANTAIYSIVDAAMLRPLPVDRPEQLVTLATPDIRQPGSETTDERESFSYPVYRDFKKAAAGSARLALTGYPNLSEVRETPQGPIVKVVQQWVSGDMFDILHVAPALGRVLLPEDDHVIGAAPYAVISYAYWQRHYGADPNVLRRAIRSEGVEYRIVGVAREGFFGVEPGKSVDVWIPASMYQKQAFDNPGWSWFRIMGRLEPGATAVSLQQRLQPVLHAFTAATIQRNPTMPPAIRKQFAELPVLVHPGAVGASQFRKDFARPLWIVLGVAAGILLIACANVASLLLARSTARASELALRISLGAGRRRLIRQLLTESLLLSTITGATGWAIARVCGPLLVNLLSTQDNPVQLILAIDTRVLLFCAAVSMVATLLFGLLPAWQSAGVDPIAVLRGASGQAGKLRLGPFFVGVQVAFAFCLVMAGASFLFSLHNLTAVNTGFDSHQVTVLSVVDEAGPEPARRVLMDRLQTRLSTLPGIQSVAMARWAIFEGSFWTEQLILPGRRPAEREEIFYNVSPGYFATMRTPLLEGREFAPGDSNTRQPIPAIVNRALAQNYFGASGVLGKQFQRRADAGLLTYRIVGVVADAHYGDLRKRPDPMVYVPLDGQNDFTVYVRSFLPIGSVVRLADRETKGLGSGMRVHDITTLDTLVGSSILKERLLAGAGGVFAFLGLALAAIGIFGLLNYSVVRRTREIGIRGALGAQRTAIIVLVFQDLFGIMGMGLGAGLAGSLALMMFLQSLFFGIKPVDPRVIATAIGVFAMAALLAVGIPAGRAVNVDPMTALRHE